MRSRAVACVLALQLAIPVAPLWPEVLGSKQAGVYWIEGTLLGVDTVQRSVSYRVETGDTRTAAVGSDAALRKLLGMEMGQQVKLKCRQTDEGSIIVEEAKKAKNAWKWAFITLGILATAGAVWLYLIFHGGD